MEMIETQGSGLDPTKEGMAYLRERAEPYADLAAALCAPGTCPGPCPGEGDCCVENGTPGCDDATCCDRN